MRKTLAAAAFSAALVLPVAAFAQAAAAPAAPEPEPEFTLAGNVTVGSAYAYRGIDQTNGKPTIQGGIDFVHKSGFYLGNWNSNISWLQDANPGLSAPIEMDFYGGYKFEVVKDVTLDFGALYYYYPKTGISLPTNPSTTELYAAAGYGPFTLKYSHAVSDTFGFTHSKNSHYLDLSASYEVLKDFSLIGHVGYQKIDGSANSECSYTDWKAGASYLVLGWTLAGVYVDTNAKDACYTGAIGHDNLGRGKVIVSISKSL